MIQVSLKVGENELLLQSDVERESNWSIGYKLTINVRKVKSIFFQAKVRIPKQHLVRTQDPDCS